MGFQKFKELEFVYEYDFDVHGGATSGAKTLTALGNSMIAGLVIEEVQVFVETAFAGSATPTCTLGITGTTAGFLADFYGPASTINTPIRSGEVAGSLLWDDTNDHEISYRPASTADATPIMTIASQALTAGKAKFVFKCRRYS
jgi:hypothetical protein